jgi:hypothetical protein
MICPNCNIEHEEVPIEGYPDIFGYHCPLVSSDPTHMTICRVQGRKSYPGIKRALTMIISPIFDDDYQCWRGEMEQTYVCCHRMKFMATFNRALRLKAGCLGKGIPDELLYDPLYHAGEIDGRGVEYRGKPIDECPFCNAEVRIRRMVIE